MDIVYQQAIALGFVFVEKFFFCMIPIYSKKFRRNKLLISLTSAFTAGIFLSAGITQLLPEADSFFNKDMSRRESRLMRKQMQIEGVSLNQGLSNEEKDFPWVHVIAGISFSMVLFLSRVIMTGGHHDDDDESEEEETNYMQADKATVSFICENFLTFSGGQRKEGSGSPEPRKNPGRDHSVCSDGC